MNSSNENIVKIYGLAWDGKNKIGIVIEKFDFNLEEVIE